MTDTKKMILATMSMLHMSISLRLLGILMQLLNLLMSWKFRLIKYARDLKLVSL